MVCSLISVFKIGRTIYDSAKGATSEFRIGRDDSIDSARRPKDSAVQEVEEKIAVIESLLAAEEPPA